jgi:hypothetical protein
MLKNCYISKEDFHDFFELPKQILNNQSYNVVTEDLLKYQLSEFKPCRLGGCRNITELILNTVLLTVFRSIYSFDIHQTCMKLQRRHAISYSTPWCVKICWSGSAVNFKATK